jgi:hypothetical protein
MPYFKRKSYYNGNSAMIMDQRVTRDKERHARRKARRSKYDGFAEQLIITICVAFVLSTVAASMIFTATH